jgi:3-oxoadipate enol-lactonase
MATEAPVPDSQGSVRVHGHDVHWERFGRGERETFVLCNGVGMHTGAWAGFLPRLLPEYDVLLWDYPGQGQSSAHDVPYRIPHFCDALALILDANRIERVHLMGISYGGFVALDFARLYHPRLHTLTVSGILLSHEELFAMYQEVSLLFYRSGPQAFEIYSYYLYEKIFGESFVRTVKDKLPRMRESFHERWKDKVHALVRLTLAQDPFFADLDAHLPGYRAIPTPTLLLAGAEDRTIPPAVQNKIAGILPHTRFHEVPDCGHVVYIEKPDVFFGAMLRLARAKSLAGWEVPA